MMQTRGGRSHAGERKENRKNELGGARGLASASPPSDPAADPFQVPIINSVRAPNAHERARGQTLAS